MREAMLILHFIGLAMGVGTSIGFMFLGMAGSKLEQEEAKKFMINSFALSRMGHIGITLLIITGGYLMTPYWSSLTSMPLMIVKLGLVLLLVVLIVVLSRASNKVKQGDASQVMKIRGLGNVALLTGIAIVVLAVLQYR
jgi:uncharacterized membrane protein